MPRTACTLVKKVAVKLRKKKCHFVIALCDRNDRVLQKQNRNIVWHCTINFLNIGTPKKFVVITLNQF